MNALSSRLFQRVYCTFLKENWSQNGTEKGKSPKVSNFQSFLGIFFKYRQTSWIGMFKRKNKEKVGYAVVFYEEVIAVFQIDTENDKKPKISVGSEKNPIFSVFMEILSHF